MNVDVARQSDFTLVYGRRSGVVHANRFNKMPTRGMVYYF